MDTLIQNGSFKTGENGLPVKIYGYDELLQRAIFCLTVPRGSFLHNKNFGSRLKDVKSSSYDAKSILALTMAQEALKNQGDVRAYSAQIQEDSNGTITAVKIGLSILDSREEVTINI